MNEKLSSVRVFAIEQLATLGADAKKAKAIPFLQKLKVDENKLVREAAAKGIDRIENASDSTES